MNIGESKAEDYIVTELIAAIEHLNSGKCDGEKGIISEYMVHSPGVW